MFDYTITDEESVKCIAGRGRVDALSAPDIQKVFDQLVLAGERLLLIDMAGVNYVSSAGLRVFLATQKQLKKVGGDLVFFALSAPVFDVFELSGVTTVFQIFHGREDVRKALRKATGGATPVSVDLPDLRIDYVEGERAKGSVRSIGSVEKSGAASYTEEDVVTVPASEAHFGCGFGALGNGYEEYKELFGEAMVVDGSFFFFPAVKHSSVDYLINARQDAGAVYRFLHGFSFNGPYRYLLSFQSTGRPVELSSLVHGLLATFRAELLGLALIGESKGTWGMHAKKAPLLAHRPPNGKSIFDPENFAEWIDFPVEPAYANHVIVATGIAARDRQALRPALQPLFPEGSNFHIHGGIFEKAPLSKDMHAFDGELGRIFNDLQVHKVQHLLGRSTFSGGLAAIIELEP